MPTSKRRGLIVEIGSRTFRAPIGWSHLLDREKPEYVKRTIWIFYAMLAVGIGEKPTPSSPNDVAFPFVAATVEYLTGDILVPSRTFRADSGLRSYDQVLWEELWHAIESGIRPMAPAMRDTLVALFFPRRTDRSEPRCPLTLFTSLWIRGRVVDKPLNHIAHLHSHALDEGQIDFMNIPIELQESVQRLCERLPRHLEEMCDLITPQTS